MLFHFVKRGPPLPPTTPPASAAGRGPRRRLHGNPPPLPCTVLPPRRQLLTWAVRPHVSLHCGAPPLASSASIPSARLPVQYVPLQRSRFCRLYLRSRVVVAGAACADADADAAAACAAAVWGGCPVPTLCGKKARYRSR